MIDTTAVPPRLDDDRHRPRYHFLPPANWMNDPNGLIKYKGAYHLFYQHNPNGAFWGTMHWGHAISHDLVHWRHMPVALAPEPGGPDQDGCYSGVAVVHEGVPTLVYTGVRTPHELPCIATSGDDHLATWSKFRGNPVIAATPPDLRTTIFRDHTLWREDDTWMMGIGSGLEDRGGAVLLYRSRDLLNWHYLHPLVVEEPALNPGNALISTGWECPDFFFLDGLPVLIACEWDGDPISVRYWTGRYANQHFTPDRKGTVDAGSPFYAPQSFTDDDGRRVMFGWLRETRSIATQLAAGWSGVMSLPRTVTMQQDGSLGFAVAPEVERLRGRHKTVQPANDAVDHGGLPGDSLEIHAVFDGGATTAIGMQVMRSPDGSETTTLLWNPSEGTLSLDTRESSAGPDPTGELASVDLTLTPEEALSLRLFIDHSVVELYANERVCISGRAYPSRPDSVEIRVIGREWLKRPIELFELLPAPAGLVKHPDATAGASCSSQTSSPPTP